jgi:hypothetical protein
MCSQTERRYRIFAPLCRIVQAESGFLGLRNDRARRRVLMGAIIVGEVGEVGECTLSLALDMLLPEEADRRRDSSMVACRLTFACEYGVAVVSRISTNLEDDMVEICALYLLVVMCVMVLWDRDGAIDRSNEATGLFCWTRRRGDGEPGGETRRARRGRRVDNMVDRRTTRK